jgi:NAD(P)-dependent dehydrogenase (short-subunit alcohol dehydrogenase family)
MKEVEQAMVNPLGKVLFIKANVTSDSDLQNLMQSTYSHMGSLHILINNAGVMLGEDDRPDNTPDWVYNTTMDVNVLGPYLAIKHAVPFMLQSGCGSIVNVGSLVAYVGSATP